jgi:hypothetical protein
MIIEWIMDEVIVELRITSDILDSSRISELVGTQFDKCWTKGDSRFGTKVQESNHGCCLSSGLPRSAPLNVQLHTLLDRTISLRSGIKALDARCAVEISCVIYSDQEPALTFSPDTVAAIAALGAGFDIDLYISTDGQSHD